MYQKGALFSIFILNFIVFDLSPVFGSSLQVYPVRLEMVPRQKTTSLEVVNTGEEPIVFEIKPVKWKNIFGQDRLEDTNDIIISPPILSIAPGEKQIIRVGITVPPDPHRGGVYRLKLREVPSPDEKVAPRLGIRALLNVSVPLVIAPVVPPKPQANWTVRKVGKDKVVVGMQNTGESYISLNQISLTKENEKRAFLRQPIGYYLIPNAKKEFELKLPCSFKNKYVELEAKTEQGDIQAKVLVDGN